MPAMKTLQYGLLAIAIFLCLGAPSASANTTTLSNNPSYATGPFLFYCEQYTTTFESGKHYQPIDGSCAFSIPSTIAGDKVIAIYKGTPGNATALAGDAYFGSATLVQEDFVPFSSPVQDEDYFAAIYDLSLYVDINNYFQTGAGLPPQAVENQNYYILPWKWGFKPPSEYDPVVIIPGILGSWEKNGTWILDPILHTYDNLVDTFLANGYVENKTLFKFPYDWENPNEDTAYILKNKIADIKTICQCSKVDLIGHSMGGLVALSYIESDGYGNDVDQLFLVATPLSGAPFAYNTWEGGEIISSSTNLSVSIENNLKQRIFTREARDAGFNSIFEYIRGKPVTSVQELLPVFSDYLKTPTFTLHYPIGYPINLFLERLVSNFDAKVYGRGVNVKVILADNKTNSTIGGFVIASSTGGGLWVDGQPTSNILVAGDGTVPRSSIEKYVSVDKEYDSINHNGVASTSTPYIFTQLTEKDAIIIVGKIYGFFDTDFPLLINKISPSSADFKSLAQTIAALFNNNPIGRTMLFVLLFSPIDMQITAPDGKHIGKDFSTGNTINEIPNALYSGPDAEHEYAIILDPLPGQYKVQTIGTGSGPYTIATSYISTATTSEAFTSGTTTFQQMISNTLTVSATTTLVTIQPQISPTPPLPALTPDTCVTDMTQAYQNKWIGKKTVYKRLVSDCKTLKRLFKARDRIERLPPAKLDKLAKFLLAAVLADIKQILADMDLLAEDKGNTQDAVLLIHTYTTWFRDHEIQ